ncbi:putative gustatory receptor 94a [Drosophila subobscura]|uniref:putative gustatory receptor 94a n=1 Tax=Drosophila subobscura TaxID=7241 RepID=UPI00155B39B7|nr:putative gustatory receptor 94a [Drosophila subobscura]
MTSAIDVTHRRMVKILTITLIVFMTVFGLLANRYDSRSRQRFKLSKAYLAYAMLWAIAFTGIYGHQIYQDYVQGQLNLRDAVSLYGYMNITVAVINYVTQMIMNDAVAMTMSRVPLFETLKMFHLDNASLLLSIGMAMFKSVGFPLILETAFILQQRRLEPDASLIWTVYRLLPLIISNLLNNCYFGAMIVVKEIVKALNVRLESQRQQVNLMQREDQLKLNTPFYRMQKFYALADELDKLAGRYMVIYVHCDKYLSLMSLSIILSLICHLLGITVGFYSQYYALADTFIADKPYDGLGALINFVFLLISFTEINMLAQLCNNLLVATRRTAIILQEMNLKHADCRYRQAVHSFTLLVTVSKFQIKPMGLYELDMQLIVNVFSAVFSFLLILVQADLSHRFRMY